MATTPNYNFDLPDIGADRNTWGGKLNGNWTAVDTALDATDTQVATNTADIATNTADIAAMMLAMNPIGTVVYNKTGTNPSTYLGGTWVPFGEGRAMVGASSGETGGEEFGSDTFKLTRAQLPADTINLDIDAGGNHAHTYQRTENITDAGDTGFQGGNNDGAFVNRSSSTDGIHSHTGRIQSLGSGEDVSIVQASVRVFAWERTA